MGGLCLRALSYKKAHIARLIPGVLVPRVIPPSPSRRYYQKPTDENTSTQSSMDNTTGILPSARIQQVEGIIGYKFTTPSLCEEALETAGYRTQSGNRSLAQVGRRGLESQSRPIGACERRFSRWARHSNRPDDELIIMVDIEDIQKNCDHTATNFFLSARGFEHGLNKHLVVNPSQRGIVAHSVMATSVEAILGAVFLDSGYDYLVFERVRKSLGITHPR
ncbi:hypothetical protein FQN52_002229 [Onygenales sp. PD_12]|nr:hypothetical protein FQN52_002229 [Onygenales sp. PD_12]